MSSDTTTSTASGSAASGEQASASVTVTSNAAAQAEPPDTGRPTPPDVATGESIHRPGMAPGQAILDGPATMTVGAHRKQGGGKGKGGSGSGRKSSS